MYVCVKFGVISKGSTWDSVPVVKLSKNAFC